jgi:hypothetical protein
MATATGAKKARKTQQQLCSAKQHGDTLSFPLITMAAAVVCADNERNFLVSATEL